MSKEVIDSMQEKMDKRLALFKKDLSTLRAGRANPQVLDRVVVDYFGTPTPLNQVGNISAPEAKLLIIAPWAAKMIPEIEKAIQKSDIGINPSNDGKIIRLVFPDLTEERRKDLVKQVKKRAEEVKISVRAYRRDANEELKKEKKDSIITEDDLKAEEDSVQKKTDDFIKQIDGIATEKEKEILEI